MSKKSKKNLEIHLKETGESNKIQKRIRRREKIFRFFVIFTALTIVVCLGFITYFFRDIFKNSQGVKAPFFRFLQNVQPAHLRGEGDGRINYLVLGYAGGTHPGPYLTDTIMVASVDPYNKKAALLSLPRDMYVSIPNYGQGKINTAFSIGEENKKDNVSGAELAKKTIEGILDLPIHYFIAIDFSGFEKAIDLVGGIDLYVEKDIYDPYFPDGRGGQTIYQIKKGWHHLNGVEALNLARSRYTTSDFDRAERQQKIIVALKEKVLSVGVLANPIKVTSLMATLKGSLSTDLTADEIIRSFDLIKDLREEEVATKVLDSSAKGLLYDDRINGEYVLLPKDPTWEEIRALAHSIFIEPFLEKEKAKVIVENAAGIFGIAFKVSELLKSRGYTVIEYRTAKENISQTKILDCSQGEKPYSLELLKKRFFITEVFSCPIGMDKEVDFVIILGQDFDYSTFSNRQI